MLVPLPMPFLPLKKNGPGTLTRPSCAARLLFFHFSSVTRENSLGLFYQIREKLQSKKLMRLCPVLSVPHFHFQRNNQFGRMFHLGADEFSDPVDFFLGNLKEELVVHLQDHA